MGREASPSGTLSFGDEWLALQDLRARTHLHRETTTQARRLGRRPPSTRAASSVACRQATCRSYASCHSGDTLGSLLSAAHTAPGTSHGRVPVKRARPARRRAGPSPGKPSQTSAATPSRKAEPGLWREGGERQDHTQAPAKKKLQDFSTDHLTTPLLFSKTQPQG